MTSNKRDRNWRLKLIEFLAVIGAFSELGGIDFLGTNYVLAQITPDSTLGNEASVLTPNVEIKGKIVDRIDGGAIQDTNLFHSFEQFNIGDLQRVYFANPAGITNIFSRVTGGNLSEIFGTLGVNGNANLFFINPNGIIFGENASLDLGGSFVASTANAIQFGDRGWFSATDPEQVPLLTVKPSAFFFNQINSGKIENRSIAPAGVDLLEEPLSGLRLPDGQSLLVVGGDIAIDGGGYHAPGGQIELAGVSGTGTVELNFNDNGLSLNVPETLERADISLTNEAFVNTGGEGGGSITVWGRQVKLTDGSQIAAPTLGSKAGRGLTVNASELVELNGTSLNKLLSSGLFTQTGGTGDAGDLTITTKNLLVENGARILAGTFSEGNAGNLTVNASESVHAIGATGFTPFGPSFSSRIGSDAGRFFGSRLRLNRLFDQTSLTGKGGNVTILTRHLELLEGAQIGASTRGEEEGGNLTVKASESVQLIGFDPIDGTVSGLFTQTEGKGDAGDLSITTRQLLIQDGAQVSAGTFFKGKGGSLMVKASESVQLIGTSANGRVSSSLLVQTEGAGDAGDLSITTRQLLIQDGAQVSAGTFFGKGKGGSLTVKASESIQLIGRTADRRFPSGLLAQTRGAGDAGDLSITTRQLLIQDGAEVTVSSFGSGLAGDLEIKAHSISLDNQGTITTTTKTGDGGDITFKDQDLLLLRRGSQISTTAGTAEAGGDGGDINIDADLIVAFPQENSDIKANAFEGKGGNININAQNILGFELIENPNLSDITASSEFGLDGTIDINTSGLELGQEAIELPTGLVDVSKLINQNLCSADREGEFIITGKGGLSFSPQDTLNTDAGWEDWRIVENDESNYQQSSQTRSRLEANNHDSHQVVEAQSWFMAANGNIILSAQPVKSVSRSSPFLPLNCYSLDKLAS